MNYPCLRLACIAFASLSASALAQLDPSQFPRQDAPNPLALSNAAAQDAKIMEDGGDYKQLAKAKRDIFYRLSLLNDIEYQSNARQRGDSGRAAMLYNPGLEGSLIWNFAPQLKFEARARIESGLYAGEDDLDYWGMDAGVRLKYQYSRKYPEFYIGPDLYRYQSLDDGDELGRAVAAVAGLNYSYRVKSTGTTPFINLQYKHQWISPSDFDRSVYRATVGVNQDITSKLAWQGFYEFRISDYVDGGRLDHRHVVGTGLIWKPLDYLSVRLNFSFIDNESNRSKASYESLNSGLGSALTWQF